MKHAESVGKTKDDLVAEMSDQLILKRMGSTDEVAAAVLFLVRSKRTTTMLPPTCVVVATAIPSHATFPSICRPQARHPTSLAPP